MYPGKDISKSGYEIWPSPSHGMRADPSIITLIKDERRAETGTGTRQVTRNSLDWDNADSRPDHDSYVDSHMFIV